MTRSADPSRSTQEIKKVQDTQELIMQELLHRLEKKLDQRESKDSMAAASHPD